MAWAGIGCGALAVVAVVVVVVFVGGWFVRRGNELVEMAKDPAALAEFVIGQHPDWDVVSHDREAGTMTIRNPATGETMTLDYAAITEGRFSVETPEGSYQVDASPAGAAGVTVETPDGRTVVGGDATLTDIPTWVPQYPAAGPSQVVFASVSGDTVRGAFSFETADPPGPVTEAFGRALEDAGFTVERQSVGSADDAYPVIRKVTVTGRTEDPPRSVTVVVTPERNATAVMVNYEGAHTPE
jgi:hypothetical protein